MGKRERKKEDKIVDKIGTFVASSLFILAWIGACFFAFQTAKYVITLLRAGRIFANAGFWHCVGVGFLGSVAFVLGLFSMHYEPWTRMMTENIILRLILLSTIISSVIGFVGIAYVFCDFCNFQLGIFKFGKVPWLLGIIISVAAFAAYYHMILNKFLAGVFLGLFPQRIRPVPISWNVALAMGDCAYSEDQGEYAVRCYERALPRLEAYMKRKYWDNSKYIKYCYGCQSLSDIYWDGDGVPRQPSKAVIWLERGIKYAPSVLKKLASAIGEVSVTRKIHDYSYEEDMEKLRVDHEFQVGLAKEEYIDFNSSVIYMAKRLSVAYSTGDGVEKDPKKALEYIKFYLELGGDAEEVKAAQSEITITTRGGDGGAAEKSVSEAAGDAPSEFSLSSIPAIVYDDSNRQWRRRGIYGDHAVYYNSDGGEVTIYSAQVSGSSAYTSAGTLHWY